MMYLLLGLFLIAFGWIAWKDIRLALGIFCFLLPSYFIRFSFGHLPTTLLELSFLVLFLVWLIKYRGYHYRDARLKNWLWPILLFALAATLSVIISPDQTAALGILKAYIIEPILLFFIIISTLKTRKDWQYIFSGLAVSALSISAFAIYQKFTGAFIPEAWFDERRVTSIFGFPNAVGLYLAPIMILGFALFYDFIKTKKYWPAVFYAIVFISSAAAIAFSKTEAAWIAVAAALFIFAMFRRELRPLAIVVAIMILIAIAFIPMLQDEVTEKIFLNDWSGQVRKVIWQESWDMLSQTPLLGAGLSGYPLAMIEFHKATYIEIFQYPHNFILNFWSEMGILGTIAWLWLVARSLWITLRAQRESNIALGLMVIFVAFLIHGLVDVPYFKNDLAMMFWIFIGLAFAIEPLDKKRGHNGLSN